MPYATVWMPPEIYISHRGIPIYYIYRNDDLDQGPLEYWYGWSVDSTTEDKCFDIRDLLAPEGADVATDTGRRTILRHAIDQGLFHDEDLTAPPREYAA